jgi:hypothetical protein
MCSTKVSSKTLLYLSVLEILNVCFHLSHEDLNKRRERPAIKDDNSDESDEPIDDQVLADESWRTFGLMNHSIVTEQFYGQYKSKLVCPTCQKVGIHLLFVIVFIDYILYLYLSGFGDFRSICVFITSVTQTQSGL